MYKYNFLPSAAKKHHSILIYNAHHLPYLSTPFCYLYNPSPVITYSVPTSKP